MLHCPMGLLVAAFHPNNASEMASYSFWYSVTYLSLSFA